MRIQHNITALNAHRNLTNNNSSVGKSLEKLSSGYRINRAGDDAAGLAISEKMRAQITGLATAQKNANDGIYLVQTAEGALTEVHSMLNRMVELATQSANGTYSTTNRQEMQKEILRLNEEIDRISQTANFNGTKLFTADGATYSSSGTSSTVATKKITLHVGDSHETANQLRVTFQAMSSKTLGLHSTDSKFVKTLGTGSFTTINGTKEKAVTIANIDLTEANSARHAISVAQQAIDMVSSMRSDFGAMQNRLDHTINNLSVQEENITAAESRIRDVDMAKEMMAYTKNNISLNFHMGKGFFSQRSLFLMDSSLKSCYEICLTISCFISRTSGSSGMSARSCSVIL
ncbi:MAG: flagellin [Dorea sp.]|nr:flagellin [Dorea sp.]